MGSYVEKYLTSKALNALWAIELSASNQREPRPKHWRPSPAMLLACNYEILLRQPSVGEKTAELIMQWKRKIQAELKGKTTSLCEDCPPIGYVTDITRCLPCPRRVELKGGKDEKTSEVSVPSTEDPDQG